MATSSDRTIGRSVIGAVTIGYFVWSVVPIAYIFLFSFDSSVVASRWEGFTLRWWLPWKGVSVFHDPALAIAVRHSVLLALTSATIALVLGTMLALGIRHLPRRTGFTIYALLVLLIAFPAAAFADALWIVFITTLRSVPFGEFGWFGTKAQIVGLITYEMPFVVLIVGARLAFISFEQEEIATDLGAAPTGIVARVVLPQLWPAIGAAALVAFTISLGEFVITDALKSTDATRSLASSFFAEDPSPTSYVLASAVAMVGVAASVLVYAALRLGSISSSRRADASRALPARE